MLNLVAYLNMQHAIMGTGNYRGIEHLSPCPPDHLTYD
jgi:hypothetical protein